jgi:hypothetical protein
MVPFLEPKTSEFQMEPEGAAAMDAAASPNYADNYRPNPEFVYF